MARVMRRAKEGATATPGIFAESSLDEFHDSLAIRCVKTILFIVCTFLPSFLPSFLRLPSFLPEVKLLASFHQ
jgi:hypothetical protein